MIKTGNALTIIAAEIGEIFGADISCFPSYPAADVHPFE